MRAPPESLRPMTGAPTFMARSMTLQIFSACASRERAAEDREVLAEDEDRAGRRCVPWPVTTPSPRILLLLHPEVGAAVGHEGVELDEASPRRAGARGARARSACPSRAACRCGPAHLRGATAARSSWRRSICARLSLTLVSPPVLGASPWRHRRSRRILLPRATLFGGADISTASTNGTRRSDVRCVDNGAVRRRTMR